MFNKMISEVYSPGINITMASDGYAFNDILGVSDRVVEQYQEISMDMAKDGPVSWFNVKDAYTGDLIVANESGNVVINGPLSSTGLFTATGSTLSGDMEVTNTLKGVILKSPDGARWRITVDNSGNLITTSI